MLRNCSRRRLGNFGLFASQLYLPILCMLAACTSCDLNSFCDRPGIFPLVTGTACDPTGPPDACTSPDQTGVLMLGTMLDLGGSLVTQVSGMSCDGSEIVGTLLLANEPSGKSSSNSSPIARTEAFRLTSIDGVEPIGFIDDTDLNLSEARAVSADGRIIIGESTSPDGRQGFRWTRTGGFVPLETAPDPIILLSANAVSGDGSLVVGSANARSSPSLAFRWTETDGYHLFSVPSLENRSCSADHVSDDGRVIAGKVDFARHRRVFRWTEESGAVVIDDSPDPKSWSRANDISGDGSTIVGLRVHQNVAEPFRWTQEEGLVGLGGMPEDRIGEFADAPPNSTVSAGGSSVANLGNANATSFDGSVIVGSANIGKVHSVAFIWDAENGMRPIVSLLSEEDKAMLEGWWLTSATVISADGRTVAGMARNPDDIPDMWVARLPG